MSRDRRATRVAETPETDRPGAASRIHSAAIHLLRRVRRVDEETGLGPARLSALSVLVFGGDRSVGELADAEQVTPPTMSRLVRALEDEGLVSRRPDPDDGRAVRLSATGEGERLVRRGQARRVDALTSLFEPLTDPEIATIDEAARLLEESLERARQEG